MLRAAATYNRHPPGQLEVVVFSQQQHDKRQRTRSARPPPHFFAIEKLGAVSEKFKPSRADEGHPGILPAQCLTAPLGSQGSAGVAPATIYAES